MRRRDLLSLIGAAAGGGAMYQAMTSLGLAAESPYRGPIRLEGDPKGASVIILGAGLRREAWVIPEQCGRRGTYSVERLMERHGDAKLPDLLMTLSHCLKAHSVSIYDRFQGGL